MKKKITTKVDNYLTEFKNDIKEYFQNNSVSLVDNTNDDDTHELMELLEDPKLTIENYKNEKLCIKIDVEGHELSVLKGLAKNIKENKCIILVESGDVKIGDVKDFLIKNNYKQIFKSKLRLDYVFSNF